MKFLSEIIKLNNPITTYIEPFAGGAGAALGLLFNNYVEKIILNDADELIYKFWCTVLNKSDKLIKKIKKKEVNYKEWQYQRKLLNDHSHRVKVSDLDIAFATFYINRCNRSGILRSEVGPIGGHGQKSKWKIDARYNKVGLIQRINRVSSYRESIEFYNLDAIDFLEKIILSQTIDREKTLVYLDPPYYNRGPELYRTFYSDEDHIRLQYFLKNKLDIRWILSYDDVPFIHDLYNGSNKNGLLMNHFANKAKVGKELIISSDNCILPNEQTIVNL